MAPPTPSSSERRDGSAPLSLVAMETRRWQHPAVCSASILIPLRGAAECVRSRHRYVTHCKMANARRMVCFALYVGLGKLLSRLLCDISTASPLNSPGCLAQICNAAANANVITDVSLERTGCGVTMPSRCRRRFYCETLFANSYAAISLCQCDVVLTSIIFFPPGVTS